MKRKIMLVGTASSVGKSRISMALCRYFSNNGFSVAPFKALNLSSHSYILPDGKKIAVSQALQAIAARIPPDPLMNPVLFMPLKSYTDCYLLGEKTFTAEAGKMREMRAKAKETAICAFQMLANKVDFIVLEGSGGCCELNLLDSDFANLPLAKELGASAILVADIERGGVFAQIYGTMILLPSMYRSLIKGIIINRFHGDPAVFAEGVEKIVHLTGIPVLGVLSFEPLSLPEEDGEGSEELSSEALNSPMLEKEIDRAEKQFCRQIDLVKLEQIIGF